MTNKPISKHTSLIFSIFLLLASFFLFANQTQASSVRTVSSDLKSEKIVHRSTNGNVYDKANLLSDSTIRKINRINDDDLASVKGHPQIAVYTTDHISGDANDFAQHLFDKYHFGTKGYDNGILILINKQNNNVRIATGYGMESVLPDIYLKHLIANSFTKSADSISGKGGQAGGGGSDSNIRIKLNNVSETQMFNKGVLNMVQSISNKILQSESKIRKSDHESGKIRTNSAMITIVKKTSNITQWLVWGGTGVILIFCFIQYLAYMLAKDKETKRRIFVSLMINIMCAIMLLGIYFIFQNLMSILKH